METTGQYTSVLQSFLLSLVLHWFANRLLQLYTINVVAPFSRHNCVSLLKYNNLLHVSPFLVTVRQVKLLELKSTYTDSKVAYCLIMCIAVVKPNKFTAYSKLKFSIHFTSNYVHIWPKPGIPTAVWHYTFVCFLIWVAELAWRWPETVKACNKLIYFNKNVVLPNERLIIFIVCSCH
jgi:hypothetical protein